MAGDRVAWDSTRPYLNRSDAAADFYNAGCPIGYFAELVPKGAPGSTNLDNPIADIVCRNVETTTPETVVTEAPEFAVENMTRYNAALGDSPLTFMTPGSLALMGFIGFLVYKRMRGKKLD